MTKEFALNVITNCFVLAIVTMWVNYVGKKIIKTIDEFELKLEREFVKKAEFNAAICDAKDGRKNLWEELRTLSDKSAKDIHTLELGLTKQLIKINTIMEIKEEPHG